MHFALEFGQDLFIELLKKATSKKIKEWKKECKDYSILYAINQVTVQLGWLMGYFSHLDKAPVPTTYLEYGAPCIQLYMEFGNKSLGTKKAKFK